MGWASRSMAQRLWFLWVVLGTVLASWPTTIHADEKAPLIGGWSVFPPYSDVEDIRGVPTWKGFDVELLREIADQAGYPIIANGVEWAEHVHEIETGERDLAPAATRTAEREKFATFSIPYRSETTVLILPRGKGATLPADNDAELVEQIKTKKFRLGVENGAAYPSKAVRAYLADPANRDRIVALPEQKLLPTLLNGRIDGYLSDRIVAAANIADLGVAARVEEHPVLVNGDIHLMFSKVTVPPAVVADFNRAIEKVREGPTYRRLNEKYTFPILVNLTLESRWFIIVDILGTCAFALSGLLLAYRYNYDIFGALVLASLPAVGGGVVRDLLTNRETLAVLSSPIYIELVVGLVVGGFILIRIATAIRESRLGTATAELLARRREHVDVSVQVFDAIGLAAFTVTGVVVALATQSHPLWIWGPILAAITAAGGGILRDVVRSEPEIPTLKGEFYPEIALIWGLLLSLYMIWQTRQLDADAIALAIVVTFAGAFLTRIATIYFGIRSLRFSV